LPSSAEETEFIAGKTGKMTLPFSGAGTLKKGLIEVTVPINEVKLTGCKIPIEDVKGGKKSKEIHQLQQMTTDDNR
jgi:hypothetical protein